jgi:hypothetical protein
MTTGSARTDRFAYKTKYGNRDERLIATEPISDKRPFFVSFFMPSFVH